jgi:hypothetical protein
MDRRKSVAPLAFPLLKQNGCESPPSPSRKGSGRREEKRRAYSIASSSGVPDEVKSIINSPKPSNDTERVDKSTSRVEEEEASEKRILRTVSEPFFNSWDYGHIEDYSFDYDESESQTEISSTTVSDDENSSELIPSRETTATPDSLMQDDPLHSTSPKQELKDIIFRKNEYGRNFVVAGTIEKLVQNLATEALPDTEYIHIFILAHTRFMKSNELLKRLVDNFKNPVPTKTEGSTSVPFDQRNVFIKSRIVNVIKLWLHASRDDFLDDDMSSQLDKFIATLENSSKEEEKSWGKALQIAAKKGDVSQPITPGKAKHKGWRGSLVAKKPKTENIDKFLDIQPKEAAKQLTLIDQSLLKNIKPRDLLTKCRNKNRASALEDISNRFDRVSGWVASEVVTTAHHKQRVLVVINFINLIDELLKLNNFHSAMSVYVGLGKTAVTRLKDTWKVLDKRVVEKWKGFETLMTPVNNFKNLRMAIARAKRPVIPPITLLVKDLTFMEENADVYPADPRLLNFEKIYLIGQVLVDIHECQKTTYDLEEVPNVREFLTDKIYVLPDKHLDTASRRVIRASTKMPSDTMLKVKKRKSTFLKLFGESL